MIHSYGGFILAAVLTGIGSYALLVRRSLLQFAIGLQLIVAAAVVVLVTAGGLHGPAAAASASALAFILVLLGGLQLLVIVAIAVALRHTRDTLDLDSALEPEPGTSGEAGSAADDTAERSATSATDPGQEERV